MTTEQYRILVLVFTKGMAAYVADYINEELARGNKIDTQTIVDALEAYEGGAR